MNLRQDDKMKRNRNGKEEARLSMHTDNTPPKTEMTYFCCCEAGAPNTPALKTDGVVAVPLLDEVPPVAVLSNSDGALKGEDCGIAAAVCPNPNENAPDPEAGVPLGVVVVAAGVLVWLFTANENLGVVVVLVVLLVLAGALVVDVDVGVPFPNTLLGVSVGLIPNTPPPNTFRVCDCGNPKGEGLVPALFENDVVMFALPPPNAGF